MKFNNFFTLLLFEAARTADEPRLRGKCDQVRLVTYGKAAPGQHLPRAGPD